MSDRPANRFKKLVRARFPRMALGLRMFRDKYLRSELRGRQANEIFSGYYETSYWGDPESKSGPGSSLEATRVIRRELPKLLQSLECRSLLDVPCGDLHWIRQIELPIEEYIGADIVPSLIERNQQLFGGKGRRFQVLDLTRDEIPAVDAILCRDCLIHLSNELIQAALQNVARSGARYFLATTFIGGPSNWDIQTGAWRPVDLTGKPFGLPAPRQLLVEEARYLGFGDKAIGVWAVEDLRASSAARSR